MRNNSLDGKTALVTGAGHRLGRELALALARHGCDVVLHYHQAEQEAAQTLQEIRSLGVQAWITSADLRNTDGVNALFAVVDEAGLSLDILINAAAMMIRRDFLDVTAADWKDSIGLNLKGTFFCLQAGARRMPHGGIIINISDIAGHEPWERFPLLSISKAGVEMLTRVAAVSLAPHIRVNAIAPGPVLKPDSLHADRWEAIGKAMPLQRTGTPQDVVEAMLFLVRSSYITGETLIVDGGWRFSTQRQTGDENH